MSADAINAVLKDIAGKSAIEEFWITDSSGHAYLTNTGVDFSFSSDAKKQPQASAFWPLITGDKKVVIQDARKREIDNKIFKFVGVAGVDKPRIVQVGVSASNFVQVTTPGRIVRSPPPCGQGIGVGVERDGPRRPRSDLP
jgi:hypothetical protein